MARLATVHDVAAYILRKSGPMTAMKLQKLCYYSYGYHLAWEGVQLFPERFEAWANGPVSPALYSRHRGRYMLDNGSIDGNPGVLTAGERESVDLVLQAYSRLTAHQLSLMTHREPPWVNARARDNVGPMDRSSEQLSDADIYEYFDDLTSAASADGAEG